MDNQIVCPHCKKSIAITEAFAHQMQEQLKVEREQAQKKFEEEKEKLRTIMKNWQEEEKKKLESKYLETQKEAEAQIKQKIQKEMELKFLDTKNESEELRKEKQALQEQMLETNRLIRQLRNELDQKNLEVEKKLAESEEKIKQEAQKQADESNRLNMMAMEKKLTDALRVNDELKRKLEQGSQQTQGEVLELQIEEMLKREFPLDEIKEVPKGKLGADLIQRVHTRSGEICGTIVWELKRTKVWNNEWVAKLKNDQREMKAEVAVIISEVLPPDFKVFGHKEGVWIGSYPSVIGLAALLRKSLLDVSLVKSASVGKKEKMEIMWEYLTSVEFKQKVEAIIEVFSAMQEDIEKEKMWFKKKWEKQESSIRRVIDNTAGMYGNLESIMGKALPEVKGLDIMGDDEEEMQAEISEKNTHLLKDEVSSLF
jgi:hypothetical protein